MPDSSATTEELRLTSQHLKAICDGACKVADGKPMMAAALVHAAVLGRDVMDLEKALLEAANAK